MMQKNLFYFLFFFYQLNQKSIAINSWDISDPNCSQSLFLNINKVKKNNNGIKIELLYYFYILKKIVMISVCAMAFYRPLYEIFRLLMSVIFYFIIFKGLQLWLMKTKKINKRKDWKGHFSSDFLESLEGKWF